MKRLLAILAIAFALGVVVCAPRATWAQDEEEGPMSNMRFLIVKDVNGKPIKNAAVVIHPVNKNGKQAMGGMELKTDDDGKTWIDGIPYGILRVQVLAPGFQTFGEDYVIKQPETQVVVRLKKPIQQTTTYGVQEKEKPQGQQQQPSQPQQSSPPQHL